MEKQDATPAVGVEEENNLLLRLTIIQLATINTRLDSLESRINLLLEVTSALPQVTSNDNASTPASTSTPAILAPPVRRTECRGHLGPNATCDCFGDDSIEIPLHIHSLIDARIEAMRQDLLNSVGQTMEESTLRTKTVVETSMKTLNNEIKMVIDRSITTMTEDIENLKRSVDEIIQKMNRSTTPSPLPRDSDIRNTMEKMRQNLTSTTSKCQDDLSLMKDEQANTQEQIRELKEEIRQLKLQGNSVTGLERLSTL